MNTVVTHPQRTVRVPLAAWLIILVLLLAAAAGFAYLGSVQGGTILTTSLSAPLNGATTAKVDIDSDGGHLTIDPLSGGEQLLASGTLRYFQNQGIPARTVTTSGAQASLTVRGGRKGQSGFRWPWAAGSEVYEWQIHLNPTVASDITAHTGGGNVKINLAGMAVTHLAADTDGGNMDVVLPDNAANLGATAKTGAGGVTVDVGSGSTGSGTVTATTGLGNVVVRMPSGLAARVHATNGLGKVLVDSRFTKMDDDTYQSPDYQGAANKIEITVYSGAGDVSVETK